MGTGPSLRRQIDRALLGFNHILLCAPNEFPVEEQTDLQAEFRKLLGYLGDILSRVRYPPAREWIQLSITETQQALDAYMAGDDKKGSDLIQAAEAHFKSYLEGRRAKPTFIAGPGGQVEKA